MKEQKIRQLEALATLYMQRSSDPIHDADHIERVRKNANTIAAAYDLTETERAALDLAVHWHDVSRAIFPKTSFIWMYFFDDLLSALMLWFWTIRYGLFGSVAGMSTRIIFCKSKTLGALCIRLFLTKRSRLLLHILEDADALDMMHTERVSRLCGMSSTSVQHMYAYKIVSFWWTAKDRMNLRTNEAKQLLEQLLIAFMQWVTSPNVITFHTNLFGEEVTHRLIARWKQIALAHNTL